MSSDPVIDAQKIRQRDSLQARVSSGPNGSISTYIQRLRIN